MSRNDNNKDKTKTLGSWGTIPYAVYNPHNKPFDELPIIYGFNNGGEPNHWRGMLLAEDGTCLGSHISSNEGFMIGDLGVLQGVSPTRQESFKQHYPDGYRLDFVSFRDVATHFGLNKAYDIFYEDRKKKGNSSYSLKVHSRDFVRGGTYTYISHRNIANEQEAINIINQRILDQRWSKYCIDVSILRGNEIIRTVALDGC